MGDKGICDRCRGRGWNWNGYERRRCRCSPHLPRVVPDPGTLVYTLVPAAEWPAFSDRLLQRMAP